MTALELLQQERIRELEYQLNLFLNYRDKPKWLESSLDLDQVVNSPVLQIPLWGVTQAIVSNLKLEVLTRADKGGFNLYVTTDISQCRTCYDEAKSFDLLIDKLKFKFIEYLKQKEKDNKTPWP